MKKYLIIILLLTTFVSGQYLDYTNWNGYDTFENLADAADTTPPVNATSVAVDTNGTDSIDVTIVFGGQSDIDSIRVQSNTSSITSRTNGTNRYAGSDTSVANSITFAHGLSAVATEYVKVYLADSLNNWNTGTEGNKAVPDMFAPTLLTFTATGSVYYLDSVEVTITGTFVDKDSLGICAQEDTSSFVVDWFAAPLDGDTTFRFEYDVDGTQGVNFFVFSKDSLNNLSNSLTDNAVIVDGAGDETAPTLTGTVALLEDITGDYYAYKIDETSIDAADGDLVGFEITVKNIENSDSTQFTMSDVIDTILTMTGLGSYGSDDSLIVRIRAYDEVPNYSTPIIDTLTRRSSDYYVFLPSIGRHLVSGVDLRFDADSLTTIDDSTFKTLNVDSSGLNGDTLKVGYPESLRENYISARIDSLGYKSDWSAWMWQPTLDSVETFEMAGDALGKDTLTINAEIFPTIF